MTLISRSPSHTSNPRLKEKKAAAEQGNVDWLASLGTEGGVKLDENGIILIGGTSLADFRVRVAQSTARSDVLPSFWSLCGILLQGGKFVSVPLDLRSREIEGDDVSRIPKCNGVRLCPLSEYDDPHRYPNIAIIRFAKAHADVHSHINRLRTDRGIIDLTTLILPWLGFVWGIKGAANPLSTGTGLPSAAFVETVFAMSGFELTPGLSSSSSCPEAIWQSAKWWTDFYESTTEDQANVLDASSKALPMTPEGYFTLRQTAAAVVEE